MPGMRRGTRLIAAFGALLIPAIASAQTADSDKLPYRQQPVDYFGQAADDPVARLKARLEQGEVRLEFRPGTGYLPALLEALGISTSSQMLVFAKNSVNARLISPRNPRALFFGDDVYVGWVPGAPALEISAVDPQKGAIFYTLRQQEDEPPRFVREESCLLCHASVNALSVPGHLARSFLTDPQGNPGEGLSRIDHDVPIPQRWGGWYVTGALGALAHRGNLVSAADLAEYRRHPEGPGRTADPARSLEASKYPALHSDAVALLVHDHQLHLHNLITRVNFEERLDRRSPPVRWEDDASAVDGLTETEERLVRYLLFADAAPLENPVLGSSAFEDWFGRQGPRDRQGRSLREFDLETRLFRYRCSYLVYSRAFDALPAASRARIERRMWNVLISPGPPAPFDRLPAGERRAIVDILRETKPDLPEYWRRSPAADSRQTR